MCQQRINGETSLYAVIGSPIKHSQSPSIYNQAFSRFKINSVYLAFEVTKEDTQASIASLKQLGVKGLNITMPCKDEALACADELDETANYVQAVNTLVLDNGRWKGYNTDGIGFWSAVKAKGYQLVKEKVLIFGSGNTAGVLMVQAVLEGVQELVIVGRDLERPLVIKELINRLVKDYGVQIKLVDLSNRHFLERVLLASDIVVQATSVGMAPNCQQTILPKGLLFKKGALVCDIVYNPLQTEFLRVAQEQGCVTLHGLHMLVGQAAVNYALFTSGELDVEWVLGELLD
ncbi:shikimate dehydrogenase [Fundicoccus sp. Sow4_F4]|uniref:shikimate dehydrogenase n=1 Tax=Fundicoccus sp. Sow4_F4 TaxID=3438783 RepID=UPI003F8DF306